jgi:hypothetical protein
MLTRLGISSWPRSDAVLVLVRQIKHRPRLARIHNGHDVRIGGQRVQEHREFVVDKLSVLKSEKLVLPVTLVAVVFGLPTAMAHEVVKEDSRVGVLVRPVNESHQFVPGRGAGDRRQRWTGSKRLKASN